MSRGVRSMNGINNIEVNNIEFPDGSTISSASSLVQLDTNNNFTGNNTFNVNLPTSTKYPIKVEINDNTILNKHSADLLYSETDENDYPTAFTRNGTTGVITLTTANTGTPLIGDTSFTSITDAQITQITTNTANISTNTNDITDNTNNITTNTTNIATNLASISSINASIISLQAQINAISTFDPTQSYTFTGNNTFTGTNTFDDALIKGQVVQTISNHERREIQTQATNNEGASEDYYVNLGRTPTNFYGRITLKNPNSWVRITVVVHISMNANLTQNSWWNGVRLMRNNTYVREAINDRGSSSTYKQEGNCWVMNTFGCNTLGSANWGSNFVNQISGTYIDKSPTLGEFDYIDYSVAIRPNVYAQYPTTAQQQIRLNGSFNQGSVGAERPAPTSFIQVEEIYKTS